jgi:hypothetical protein
MTGMVDDLEDSLGRHRLAAAAFADEAQRLAGRDIEIEFPHHIHAVGEGDGQVADFNQVLRGLHGRPQSE